VPTTSSIVGFVASDKSGTYNRTSRTVCGEDGEVEMALDAIAKNTVAKKAIAKIEPSEDDDKRKSTFLLIWKNGNEFASW
jgi:hypothetical protein